MAVRLLNLTITRVDQAVFNGEVVSVVVPGAGGIMEILAHHQALISPLKAGVIKIKNTDSTIEEIKINNGTLEISHNHATILI